MITAMIRTHDSRITESFGNFQFLAGLLTDKNKKSHGNIGQQPKNSGKLSKSVRQILLDQFRDVVGIPRFSIFANLCRSAGFLQIFADVCRSAEFLHIFADMCRFEKN